jgi:hypothetical protein
MNYYWELIQFDGTRIEIPPSAVEVVNRRWSNGDPIITDSMTIPANQIKTFRKTNKLFGQQPLLEAAAQAFNEPVLNEDGSIGSRWVKKSVTQTQYNKHYSAISAYRHLGEEQGMVTVAFRLPIHQIDHSNVDDCTEAEVLRLTRN